MQSIIDDVLSARTETTLEFWIRQNKEHALFIALGLNREDLKSRAMDFHDKFKSADPNNRHVTRNLFIRFYNYEMELVDILTNPTNNTPGNPAAWIGSVYPSFIEHVASELLYALEADAGNVLPEEEVSFLNDMNSEHAILAAHLLDPTQTKLIEQAYLISDRFLNTKDLDPEANVFIRFTLNSAEELDRYNKKAYELLSQNKLPGIIHPVLLVHILREGQRSLAILEEYKMDNIGSLPYVPNAFKNDPNSESIYPVKVYSEKRTKHENVTDTYRRSSIRSKAYSRL